MKLDRLLMLPGAALLALLTACATSGTSSMAPASPRVVRSMVASGAGPHACKQAPQRAFTQQDFIVFCVQFGWQPSGARGGAHAIEWRWYQEERFLSRLQKPVTFASNPYTLWTRRAAATLGSGHFKVEALVDGTVAASVPFDITPQ